VPHATKSIDGKNIANSKDGSGGGMDRMDSGGSSDPFPTEEEERTGKPVADKVRMSPGKRSPKGDDWEPDNDTMEDAGYNPRKFEDDED
jgi:hypothetical protein